VKKRARGRDADRDCARLRRALVWVVALKVAAITLVLDPVSIVPFDMPKVLVGRITGLLLLGLLAIIVARSGLSAIPRSPVHWAVGAVVLANVVSVGLAEDRYIALYGEFRRFLGISFLLDMVVLYLAIAVAFRDRRDWAVLAGAVAASAGLSIGYGLVQAAGLDPVPWTKSTKVRPVGTFGNADLYSHFLVVFASGALSFAAFARARGLRIAAGVLALAALLAAALSATRAGVLGVGAGAAATFSLMLASGVVSRVRALGILVATAVLGGIALLVTPLGQRILGTFRGEVALSDRLLIWDSALHAFADRPLFGWGPDSFGVAYSRYRQPGSQVILFEAGSLIDQAHSWVLETAVSTGAIGLVTLVALITVATVTLWRGFRSGERALCAAALAGLAAYWVQGLISISSVGVDWLPWVCFGAAASIGARTQPVPKAAFGGALAPVATLAAVAVLLVGTLGAIDTYNAGLRGQASRVVAATAPDQAVAAAADAIRLDGGRDIYWSARGEAYIRLGRWAAAADDFERAAALYPHRAALLIDVAKARAEQILHGDRSGGGSASALAAAQRARELDPNNSEPHQASAGLLLAFDQPMPALREIVTAIRLNPVIRGYDTTAAAIAEKSTDRYATVSLLTEALSYKDSATLRIALGKTYLRLGDQGSAREQARRALELEPKNAEAQRLVVTTGGP